MSTGNEARILGLGEHRPARLVTNDDLAGMVETSDEWIRTRTGIATRRVAAGDESVVAMATDAAAKALAQSGVAADDVDLLLLATCTTPTTIPGGAPEVAHLLGATHAGAADLNGACAGFCYALAMAADAVRAGSARHAVVIGAEKLTDWLDWSDRSTCILFGDGAAAAVVGPSDEPGIGRPVWGSDGSAAGLITAPAPERLIRMDGQAVFRWATTTLAPVALQACAAAGVSPADLGAVVLHQANLRIVDAIVRALQKSGLRPDAVISRDVVETGNTSAASVPLALSRLAASGEVRSGEPALLLAFGAGLTWAGQVIRIP